MSFSSDVRRELCGVSGSARHCWLAETAALLNACGAAGANGGRPAPSVHGTGGVTVVSENEQVIRRFRALTRLAFDTEGTGGRRGRAYTVTLNEDLGRLLGETVYAPQTDDPPVLPPEANLPCCRRAYIRGSFIACGTLSDPAKTYHLEFSLPANQRLARGLSGVLRSFGLHPRIHPRGSHTLVYVKESEEIADLLNIMEAHKSLLQLENMRILKEIGNSVNRRVNFETANLGKTVKASLKQIEDIRYIAASVGLGYLPDPLAEVARLRMTYESASLKEIGGLLDNPVGKSGVNHRLRRISETADTLRKEQSHD